MGGTRSTRLLVALVATAVALAASVPIAVAQGSGGGDGPRTREEALRAMREAYDEVVAEEAETLAAYEASVERREELAAEVEANTRALEFVQASLAEARARAREAEIELGRSRVRLAQLRGELAASRMQLRRQAVDAYIGGSGGDPVAEAVLGNELSSADAVGQYADTVLVDQATLIGRIGDLETAEAGERERAERLVRDADATRDEIADFEDELSVVRELLQIASWNLQLEINRQEALLAELRARKEDYYRRLHALENDSDGVAAVLQAWQAGQPVGAAPRLMNPTLGANVVSGFGNRMHPIFQEMRMHRGIDLDAPMGAPIRAAADGTVAMAEMREGFGNVVVIDHGGQIATVYAHQSRIDVSVGEWVWEGQIIGRVGSTGYSTGPHLHLEVRVFGNAVDPLGYVDFSAQIPCNLLWGSAQPEDVAMRAQRPDCPPPPPPA